MQNYIYKIGIDFDNTIICYNEVFNKIGIEKNLIPENLPCGKNHVRDYLRKTGQEEAWIELQGYVYGAGLFDAYPFEGVKAFFLYCQDHSIDCCIISHKTLYPYRGYPYDLHKAAYQWLDQNDFHCKIFFELTTEDKLKRIFEQKCTHFVDDLPEFLNLPGFTSITSKLLFDPLKIHRKKTDFNYNNIKSEFKVVNSWKELLFMLKNSML